MFGDLEDIVVLSKLNHLEYNPTSSDDMAPSRCPVARSSIQRDLFRTPRNTGLPITTNFTISNGTVTIYQKACINTCKTTKKKTLSVWHERNKRHASQRVARHQGSKWPPRQQESQRQQLVGLKGRVAIVQALWRSARSEGTRKQQISSSASSHSKD